MKWFKLDYIVYLFIFGPTIYFIIALIVDTIAGKPLLPIPIGGGEPCREWGQGIVDC